MNINAYLYFHDHLLEVRQSSSICSHLSSLFTNLKDESIHKFNYFPFINLKDESFYRRGIEQLFERQQKVADSDDFNR